MSDAFSKVLSLEVKKNLKKSTNSLSVTVVRSPRSRRKGNYKLPWYSFIKKQKHLGKVVKISTL